MSGIKLRSKCCYSEVEVCENVDEGAEWYICKKCNKYCDIGGDLLTL